MHWFILYIDNVNYVLKLTLMFNFLIYTNNYISVYVLSYTYIMLHIDCECKYKCE